MLSTFLVVTYFSYLSHCLSRVCLRVEFIFQLYPLYWLTTMKDIKISFSFIGFHVPLALTFSLFSFFLKNDVYFCIKKSLFTFLWGFPGGSVAKNLLANAGDTRDAGSIPGQEDSLEEEMTTHSSILTWKIPWTEEPGHGVTKSGTWRKLLLSMHTRTHLEGRILCTSENKASEGS